jgi:hypothetical protein
MVMTSASMRGATRPAALRRPATTITAPAPPQRSTTARGNPRSADGDSATWTISALPSQGLTQGLVRYGRGHSAMAGSPDTGEASRVRSDTMYVKGA